LAPKNAPRFSTIFLFVFQIESFCGQDVRCHILS
jgi:hypothetical protein